MCSNYFYLHDVHVYLYLHVGVMYKMFRVSDSTTVLDLVSMALKKANLIEDSHSYAIYNIQTSNKGMCTCTCN